MTLEQAMDFIGPAVPPEPGRWADLGAGSGTFTEALAHMLGRRGSVVAVERDDAALGQLRRLARRLPPGSAPVRVLKGDLEAPHALRDLAVQQLDGALLGNVLHFVPDPSMLLGSAREALAKDGRVVVLEYEGRSPSRWIPHPVSKAELARAAAEVGLGRLTVVNEKPSRYRGTLYCGVLTS